jgi:hypothetical protein
MATRSTRRQLPTVVVQVGGSGLTHSGIVLQLNPSLVPLIYTPFIGILSVEPSAELKSYAYYVVVPSFKK